MPQLGSSSICVETILMIGLALNWLNVTSTDSSLLHNRVLVDHVHVYVPVYHRLWLITCIN